MFPGLSWDGIVADIIGGASDITLGQQQRLVLWVLAVILEPSSGQVAVWVGFLLVLGQRLGLG